MLLRLMRKIAQLGATAQPEGNFFIDDYVALLAELKARGVTFETLGEPDLASASSRKAHFIKHDIHHDMVNTLRVAEAEHRAGVRSTFFMMHECELNRKYFARRDTWEGLSRIRDMGHEIGLHIDGFDLVERFGDLGRGIEAARAAFGAHGFTLRVANTHGNSDHQAKFDFETVNFFKELARPTPCTDAFWMGHYARYSIAELGFRLWADTALWTAQTGEFLLDYFVTDNSRAINAGRMRASSWELEGAHFELSAELRFRLADLVSDGSCLYLVHPQFFRPRHARAQ
jgi:hypothetical protein